MLTYKQLYARACKKGKLRTDEYTPDEFIDDVNDLARGLWTTIFQGVNGNKPDTTRKESFVVASDLTYTHTRAIKKTPIQKIVYEECETLVQRTDKITNQLGECLCTTYEYDDDKIRLDQSADGDYEVFYEAGAYTELTLALYNADAEPAWIKDDFIPVFWAYTAFLNTDTKKEEMLSLYQMFLNKFEKYYSRTETLEDQYMIAFDTFDEL